MKTACFDVKSDKNEVKMMCFDVEERDFEVNMIKNEQKEKENDVGERSFEVDFLGVNKKAESPEKKISAFLF